MTQHASLISLLLHKMHKSQPFNSQTELFLFYVSFVFFSDLKDGGKFTT